MKLPMCANQCKPFRAFSARLRQRSSDWSGREGGQSMLEMTVGLVFLVIIVLIVFEMAVLFYRYIALLNASREGAVFAATHPYIAERDSGDPDYVRFETITTAEAVKGGLDTDQEFFVILPPETPYGIDPLEPIIVRVRYQLINPTSGIILPFMGRMGLFQSAWMTASTEMPIQ
jgi:hypothetical protein